MKQPLYHSLIALLLSVMVLAGCTAPASPEGASVDDSQQTASDGADTERANTVIFDIDQGPVTDPNLWNPFAPSRRLDHGLMQAMAEPLVILNYETGEYMPWLAASVEANDDSSVWTMTLAT